MGQLAASPNQPLMSRSATGVQPLLEPFEGEGDKEHSTHTQKGLQKDPDSSSRFLFKRYKRQKTRL